LISTPETVKRYINMIEDLYKSGEYMNELDDLENVADTLLQVIMDDGKDAPIFQLKRLESNVIYR
jgi:hypothetical protein